ncbi:hypothetical protein GCM10009846_24620 [Agrococcus versicolor]|uniref:Uncharacterized protein n=2 Tax=Agrococcus versicolor TaxID=501482 RepID=A0ABP5MMP8_9MICO
MPAPAHALVHHEPLAGAIAFDAPVGWTVEESLEPPNAGVVLRTPEGLNAFSLSLHAPSPDLLVPSGCQTDPSAAGSIGVLSSEPLAPFADDLASAAPELALVTVEHPHGVRAVMLLTAQDAAIGCLGYVIPVAGGSIFASSHFDTDDPTALSLRFRDGEEFVGSPEYVAVLDVLRSVEIRRLVV